MERNNPKNHLINLFQAITFQGVSDENVQEIEDFLMKILDSKEYNEIFDCSIFYNFVTLLKKQEFLSPILYYLIQEIELKALRLEFSKFSGNEEKKEKCQECNGEKKDSFKLRHVDNQDLWPKEGETAVIKTIEEDKEKGLEYETTFKIDSHGNPVEFISRYAKFKSNSASNLDDRVLNRSPLSRLKEKYENEEKITENDLQ